jgi:hypothetical protein
MKIFEFADNLPPAEFFGENESLPAHGGPFRAAG